MDNFSLDYIRNFSTNTQVINKINEMMAKRIKYYKLRDPEDADNVENFVYRDTVDILSSFRRYNRPDNEYNIDKILSKQIITHLQEFFNKTTKSKEKFSKTKKNFINRRNKTFKK